MFLHSLGRYFCFKFIVQGGAAAKPPVKAPSKPSPTTAVPKGSSHKCEAKKPSSPTKRTGSATKPGSASGRPGSSARLSSASSKSGMFVVVIITYNCTINIFCHKFKMWKNVCLEQFVARLLNISPSTI